jgi:hypothetical protein
MKNASATWTAPGKPDEGSRHFAIPERLLWSPQHRRSTMPRTPAMTIYPKEILVRPTLLRPVVSAAAAFAATCAACPATGAEVSASGIALVGNATMLADGSVQLTAAEPGQTGAAWVLEPIDTSKSFEARFSYSLVGGGDLFLAPQADGIAFVIQNAGTGALGNGGGGLGFQGLRSAASVIRTFFNNNIGITPDGDPSDVKPFDGALIGDCATIEGRETVTYDATNLVLKMATAFTCDGVPYQAKNARHVDLPRLLGPTATIGMTGAGGSNYADQRVRALSFTTLP